MTIISDFLEKLFYSRAQTIKQPMAEFFVSEIMAKNYPDEVFDTYIRDYICDDSYKLTLGAILTRLNECSGKVKQKYALPYSTDEMCPYCDNTGIAHYNLTFDRYGNWIPKQAYGFRCRCGRNQSDIPRVTKGIFNHKDGSYTRELTKIEYEDLRQFVEKHGKDIL